MACAHLGLLRPNTLKQLNPRLIRLVPTGWGGWIKGYAPELYGASRGHALVVFSLL